MQEEELVPAETEDTEGTAAKKPQVPILKLKKAVNDEPSVPDNSTFIWPLVPRGEVVGMGRKKVDGGLKPQEVKTSYS